MRGRAKEAKIGRLVISMCSTRSHLSAERPKEGGRGRERGWKEGEIQRMTEQQRETERASGKGIEREREREREKEEDTPLCLAFAKGY